MVQCYPYIFIKNILSGLKQFRNLFVFRENICLQSWKFVCLRIQHLRVHRVLVALSMITRTHVTSLS